MFFHTGLHEKALGDRREWRNVLSYLTAREGNIFKRPPWNTDLRTINFGAPWRKSFVPFRPYIEQSLVVFMAQSRRFNQRYSRTYHHFPGNRDTHGATFRRQYRASVAISSPPRTRAGLQFLKPNIQQYIMEIRAASFSSRPHLGFTCHDRGRLCTYRSRGVAPAACALPPTDHAGSTSIDTRVGRTWRRNMAAVI